MHPTEARRSLLTNPEREQGVTLEGPTELYFVNPREWGSGRIRVIGKGSPSGGDHRGYRPDQDRPSVFAPSDPSGPRGP